MVIATIYTRISERYFTIQSLLTKQNGVDTLFTRKTLGSNMQSDPFATLINQILQGLTQQLNGEIGPAIRSAGYDPYNNVASGSASIGIGSASYSVSDLTGVSSLQITDLVATNITASGTNISGQVNFQAVLNSPLGTTVGGSVEVWPIDIGVSGNIRITGCSISGSAQLIASISNNQLCLNSIGNLSVSFNYNDASIWINDLGVLNYLLSPLESLILDAAKGAIRNLISSQIDSIVAQQIGQRLPQCASLG